MIGKVFSFLVTSSFVFAFLGGNMDRLSAGILSAATDAVELVISLVGMMCLWSGVLAVFRECGITKLVSKAAKPFLRFAYPEAFRTGVGAEEISSNFAANLFGMGNAALPSGLAAMEKLSLSAKEGEATREMITFAVMNTVPFQLFPTTLIAMRSAAGSMYPYEIITPIYVCSVLSVGFAVLLCRFLPMKRNVIR